ncbi:MAG: extracellular solute-binding protein [Chitinophagales bacterium]|nr:extracellular solute-binding protein [Chitinophagales bacterium]
MFLRLRYYIILTGFIQIISCSTNQEKDKPLLFWCSNNQREIELFTQQTEVWNNGPSGIPIHLQPIPEGQSSEEVILAAVVGKTTPDIYANMWQGSVELYARAGTLIPLDTLKGFLKFIYERCDSSVIKEITSSDGHIYQVPWKVNPIMTIYNQDIFLANGITEIPDNYSKYRQAAEVYKSNSRKNGQTHNWFGYTEVKPIWYERLFNFYPLYLAASGGASLIRDNKAVFNNEYSIEVFRFLQSLYRDGYFTRERLSAAGDAFVLQQITTKWTGPWEISYLLQIPDRHFKFDYYAPPVPDDHVGPVYTYADPKNIVVFNTCTRPQEAWDFMKTLIDKNGDLKLLETTGQLPRRKDLQTDAFYTDYFTKNPMMMTFAKQVPFSKGIDNCEVIVEVLDIISQEYEACVVYGKKTPEKAIEDAERAVNVLLGENTPSLNAM